MKCMLSTSVFSHFRRLRIGEDSLKSVDIDGGFYILFYFYITSLIHSRPLVPCHTWHLTGYIYKLFPTCQMFSDCHWCTERNAQCNIVHWIVHHKPRGSKKCVKFAITSGLSNNCPRKYWMTDRSPNRIRTFSEVQTLWTPIYTSILHADIDGGSQLTLWRNPTWILSEVSGQGQIKWGQIFKSILPIKSTCFLLRISLGCQICH